MLNGRVTGKQRTASVLWCPRGVTLSNKVILSNKACRPKVSFSHALIRQDTTTARLLAERCTAAPCSADLSLKSQASWSPGGVALVTQALSLRAQHIRESLHTCSTAARTAMAAHMAPAGALGALPVSAALAAAAFLSDLAQDSGRPEDQLWLHMGSTVPASSTQPWDNNGSSMLCCTGQLLESPALLEQLRQLGAVPAQLRQELHHSHDARQQGYRPAALQSRQVSFFDAIVQQLDAVGWHHLLGMSEDLSQLELGVHDAAGRLHRVQVQLPHGFPATAPGVTLQLPEKVALSWDGGHELRMVVQQVQQALARYQALWDVLEDVDQHTQVLEPHPDAPRDYSSCSRRIALSRHASLHLTLDPASPATRPAVTFLGSDAAVGELQRRWFDGGSSVWDVSRGLRDNLEAVLQQELPRSRRGDDGGDGELDRSSCAICFGPTLADDPGSVASVVCGAPACGRAFHPRCLVEWLQSVVSTRCFRTLFGECPYCNGSISVALDS